MNNSIQPSPQNQKPEASTISIIILIVAFSFLVTVLIIQIVSSLVTSNFGVVMLSFIAGSLLYGGLSYWKLSTWDKRKRVVSYLFIQVFILYFSLGWYNLKPETVQSGTANTPLKETPQELVKLKNITVSNMGGGVAELDFKIESSLPSDTSLDVIVWKEVLTDYGFKRCQYPDTSLFNYPGTTRYTVAEMKQGVGVPLVDKDFVESTCFKAHYSPSEENKDFYYPSNVPNLKKLFPLWRISVGNEQIETQEVIPVSKALKFY